MTLSFEPYQNESSYYLCFSKNPMVCTFTFNANDFSNSRSSYELAVIVAFPGRQTEYQFSQEVGVGTFKFDIHSAWVDEYAKSETILTTRQYPPLMANIYYQISYIQNGELTKTVGQRTLAFARVFALKGGVTDTDIRRNSSWYNQLAAVWAKKDKLTRMPDKPLVPRGGTYFKSALSLATAADIEGETGQHMVNTTTTTVGVNTTSNSDFTVVNDPRRVEFRFVNSFGVIESFFPVNLEAKDVKVTQTSHQIVGDLSFMPTGYSRNIATAKEVYTMSSGYLPAAWLDWFATEFLTAKRHWLTLGSLTNVPVSIKAKDNLSIYDKSKGELNEIQFEVTLA